MDSIKFFRFGVRRSSLRFALLSALVTMGPCFALPLAVLACCLLPADSCILCTKESRSALDSFQKKFLPGRLDFSQNRLAQFKLGEISSPDWVSNEAKGIPGYLDEKTVREVAQDFQNALKHITDSNAKGQQLVDELTRSLEELKNSYYRKSIQFEKEGLCPNDCGVMLQPVLSCRNCQITQRTCKKSSHCGVRDVKVREMEDLVLDCRLSWHRLSEGLTDYSFFRVWKKNSETLMHRGKEAVYTRRLVGQDDAGVYRCVLGSVLFGPATIIEYHVTVLPRKDRKKPEYIVPEQKTTTVHVTTVHVTTVHKTTVGVVTTVEKAANNNSHNENPNQENPNQEKPNKENPNQENPDKENPNKENPDKENPSKENPDKENPNKENPDKENPNKENPDKENPNTENPDNEKPNNETSTDETPVEVTSLSTTSIQPETFSMFLEPSQTESMLQGRLLGLLICFLILLLLLISIRLFIMRKKKAKPESSKLGSEKKASSQTKVGSTTSSQSKAAKTPPAKPKVQKTPPAKPKVQKTPPAKPKVQKTPPAKPKVAKTGSTQPEKMGSKTQKK